MSRRNGKVCGLGELRNAGSDESIAAGDRVILTGCCAIVTTVRGMTVKVEKERGGV